MRHSQPPHASDIPTFLYLHFMSACLHVSLSPRLYHNVLGFSSASFTPVPSTSLSFPTSLIISASFRTLSCTVIFIMSSYPCIFLFAQGSLFQETKLQSPLLSSPSFDISIYHPLYRKAKPKCPKISQHSPGPVSLASIHLAKSTT